jgi:hypothetical protein
VAEGGLPPDQQQQNPDNCGHPGLPECCAAADGLLVPGFCGGGTVGGNCDKAGAADGLLVPGFCGGGTVGGGCHGDCNKAGAAGGMISGGVPDKDSVLINTMPGELIVPKAAVPEVLSVAAPILVRHNVPGIAAPHAAAAGGQAAVGPLDRKGWTMPSSLSSPAPRPAEPAHSHTAQADDSSVVMLLERILAALEASPGRTGGSLAQALNSVSTSSSGRALYSTGSGYGG